MILFIVSSVLMLQTSLAAPANGDQAELLVAATNGVYRINLANNDMSLVVEAVNATSVDYHHAKRLLFWSDVATHKIYCKDLFDNSGEIKTVVAGTDDWEPRAIAIDYVNDKIYVMDQAGRKIDVFELDGSKKIVGIQTDLVEPDAVDESTMDIAVNPIEGLLFYGDSNKVMRATLDFKSVKQVAHKSFISGLTLDSEIPYFYITETDRLLYKQDYDGNRHDYLNAYDHPSDFIRGTPISPRTLSKFQSNFYWVDRRDNLFPGIHKLETYYSTPVNTEIKGVWNIKVLHSSVQKPNAVKNYAKGCKKANCKYMCLASNPTYSKISHSCM